MHIILQKLPSKSAVPSKFKLAHEEMKIMDMIKPEAQMHVLMMKNGILYLLFGKRIIKMKLIIMYY